MSDEQNGDYSGCVAIVLVIALMVFLLSVLSSTGSQLRDLQRRVGAIESREGR